MKKWIKARNGTLYVDTKDPNWQEWFKSEVKRLVKYKIAERKEGKV